jgi:hypothetical protein
LQAGMQGSEFGSLTFLSGRNAVRFPARAGGAAHTHRVVRR